MLNIRQFVKGLDEPAWVKVLNAAHKEYKSWWRAITVGAMLLAESTVITFLIVTLVPRLAGGLLCSCPRC